MIFEIPGSDTDLDILYLTLVSSINFSTVFSWFFFWCTVRWNNKCLYKNFQLFKYDFFFNDFIYMNKILILIIKFQKLIQTIHRILNWIRHRKELIWSILACALHWLWTITQHIMFCKFILKSFIKELQLNFQPFSTIVTNISHYFLLYK